MLPDRNAPADELARIAEEAKRDGKKLPKIGVPIPFNDLLSDYKTSFGDAYKKSKKHWMEILKNPKHSKKLSNGYSRPWRYMTSK